MTDPNHSPIDIQHPYEGFDLSALGVQGRVEPLDGPCEQLAVDVFSQCVSGLCRLLTRHGFDQHLSPYSQPAMTQPVGHLRSFNSQKLREDGQRAVICLKEDRESGLTATPRCTVYICLQSQVKGGEGKTTSALEMYFIHQYNPCLNFSRWLGC